MDGEWNSGCCVNVSGMRVGGGSKVLAAENDGQVQRTGGTRIGTQESSNRPRHRRAMRKIANQQVSSDRLGEEVWEGCDD